ncbi:MAG: M15 family metallopeptidase [Bacteroides sp.]|nr:M15 family metallopeptidase [Bacteroides sp.]
MINKQFYLILYILTLIGYGCTAKGNSPAPESQQEIISDRDTLDISHPPALSPTALLLDSLGYTNLADADSTIVVHLVYATPNNFMGEVLYEGLTEAYLLPEAATKLVKAHQRLKEKHPGYRFIIYDTARPIEVQRKIWKLAVSQGKQYYVANPAKGGLHNYGAAVDLSIVDEHGIPLPMGSDFDYFGPESNIDKEEELVREGKITREELNNRKLLREVMQSAGFTTVRSEWWHFNHCSRDEARARYPLIEFSLHP